MKNKMAVFRAGLMLAGLALAATHAGAAIVYVDATYGSSTTSANTTLAAGGAFGNVNTTPVGSGLATTNDGSSVDNLWRERPGFGNGPSGTNNPYGGSPAPTNSIFEALGNNGGSGAANGEDVPRLKTTVSGLPLGDYAIWVFWWQDQAGSPWRVEGSLTDNPGGPLPLYTPYNNTSALASSLSFANPVPLTVDSANRVMWGTMVGMANATSFFDVFVDSDFSFQSIPVPDGNSRTWYDGVGYELKRLVPEPTSLTLLGLGLSVTLVAGRNRRSEA